MTVTLHWFLPTSGDGRTVVERFHRNRAAGPAAGRQPDIDYLAQVARTAEQLGFTGVLALSLLSGLGGLVLFLTKIVR